MRNRVFLALAFYCLISAPVFAQTTAFTYQGKLVDNGNLANAAYDMQFKLFDSVSGGTQIGATLTYDGAGANPPAVTVTNGIFAVTLDFGSCSPASPCFNSSARFLEIAVRAHGGSYTTLTPRQPITSTPYAMKTLNLTFNAPYDDGAGTSFTASNSFAGDGAGLNTTPNPNLASPFGKFNSFFGAGAGKANTTGIQNDFFGAQAGQANTTGIGNAFFGTFAGNSNTTGNNNAFFGSYSGKNNTIGGSNAFFGVSAGVENLSGINNTFIGYLADFNVSSPTGNSNTLLGANTHVNSSVSNGTAIGAFASVTQSNSLVLGSINGVNGATADTKVGIGTSAPGFKLEVVDPSNTGLRVQTNTTGGTVASFGGVGAFNIDSNGQAGGRFKVQENGNIGIGTNNPTSKLHVSGTGIIRALVNSDSNAGFGLALSSQQKWSVATVTGGNFQIFNDAIGSNAFWIDSASNNAGIGTITPNARLTVDGGNNRGLVVTTNNSGEFVAQFGAIGSFAIDSLTNGAGRFLVDNNNTVWINMPPPGVPLNNTTDTLIVNGAIKAVFSGGPSTNSLCKSIAPGTSTIVLCSSSIRYKTNVNTFSSGLNLIRRLRPVSFNWKQGGMKDFGLIAEEVADVEPLLATYDEKGEIQGVKYDRVSVVLINAVKEQQAQIAAQQTQLKQQTEQIQNQQREIEDLKRLVCLQQPKAQICQIRTPTDSATRKLRSVKPNR